jgi:hypothetical protein
VITTSPRLKGGAVQNRFAELDNLVLDLKGLVLVRTLREQSGADPDELGMFSAQIENVRHRLASLVENGRQAA